MKFPDDQPMIEPSVVMSFFTRFCMMGRQAGKKTWAEDRSAERQ